MNQTIHLKNIKLYGYHGCFKEEALTGANFRVDLSVKVNLEKAMQSDDLNDTLNYVKLYEIVKNEMGIRSNLLENVAHRILDKIFNDFNQITEVTIAVAKLAPPINGAAIESVSIEITKTK